MSLGVVLLKGEGAGGCTLHLQSALVSRGALPSTKGLPALPRASPSPHTIRGSAHVLEWECGGDGSRHRASRTSASSHGWPPVPACPACAVLMVSSVEALLLNMAGFVVASDT